MKQVAEEVGLAFYARAYAPIQTGLAMVLRGEPAAAIIQLQSALEAFRASGFEISVPLVRSTLAQAFGAVGRIDQGLEEVTQALAQIARQGWEEHMHHADVLVTRGSLLRHKGDSKAAESSYRDAIDMARDQQAKSWELRAATSLARLWQDQGKRKEGYDLLAPVYGWFTEGFGTRDLMDAKALLEELRA